jgi:hypothetical protein
MPTLDLKPFPSLSLSSPLADREKEKELLWISLSVTIGSRRNLFSLLFLLGIEE